MSATKFDMFTTVAVSSPPSKVFFNVFIKDKSCRVVVLNYFLRHICSRFLSTINFYKCNTSLFHFKADSDRPFYKQCCLFSSMLLLNIPFKIPKLLSKFFLILAVLILMVYISVFQTFEFRAHLLK